MWPNPFVYGWRDIPNMAIGFILYVLLWPFRKWG